MNKPVLKPARLKRVGGPATPAQCAPAPAPAEPEVRIQSPYARCPLYGVALVAAEVFDPEFTIHGPQGCVAAVIEAFAIQRKEVEFQTSSMTKDDIVFGGEKRLFEAIADAYTPYEKAGPKFIITTCSSEIIGDNVRSVTAKFNDGLPTVVVPGGGVNGDHFRGVNNALAELTVRFAREGEKVAGRVNLIGNVGLSRQWKGDFHEMERLLKRMGLSVNPIGCDSVTENYELAATAELTVLLTPEIGIDAAKQLEKRFGVPYFSSSLFIPLGLRGTEVWLRELGARLGLSEAMLDALIDEEEERVRSTLKVGLYQMTYIEKLVSLKQLPVAVVAEGPIAFGWARFLAEELEMKPVLVGMRSGRDDRALGAAIARWNEELGIAPRIASVGTYRDVETAFAETQPKMVLGSSVDGEVAGRAGIPGFLHITHPNTSYITVVDRPFLGYDGVINVTEAIVNMMR